MYWPTGNWKKDWNCLKQDTVCYSTAFNTSLSINKNNNIKTDVLPSANINIINNEHTVHQ